MLAAVGVYKHGEKQGALHQKLVQSSSSADEQTNQKEEQDKGDVLGKPVAATEETVQV